MGRMAKKGCPKERGEAKGRVIVVSGEAYGDKPEAKQTIAKYW